VSSASVTHSFHAADGTVVLSDERICLNMTDISVRMICELSNSSDGRRGIILKFNILVSPPLGLKCKKTLTAVSAVSQASSWQKGLSLFSPDRLPHGAAL
jgi:hypothetical protein